jgi:hypothetical protein
VPYLTNVHAGPPHVSATLAAADFHAFMDYARANNVRILSCAIARQTLEQRFVEIVSGSAPHA